MPNLTKHFSPQPSERRPGVSVILASIFSRNNSTTTISYIWATGELAKSLRLDSIQNNFPGDSKIPGGKLPDNCELQRNYYYTIIFQVGPNRCLIRENHLSMHN